MSPFLLSAGQASIDAYRKEMLVKEYLAKQAKLASTTTPAPAIEMSDESSLHIESNESNESSDVSLDQSNNGFSLVNIHWASFSTGLSSVLVVVLAGLFIAGCCYFRGRRQRQSRARHSELLHALSSKAHHTSTPPSAQSVKYPGSPAVTSPASITSPASVDSGFPVVRYSAASASASTAYERAPFSAVDRPAHPRFLPVSHDPMPAVTYVERVVEDRKPSAPFPDAPRPLEYTPRQTGISSLVG